MRNRIAIVSRGCGKTQTFLKQLREDIDKGEQIVFMTKDGLTELEALKNYKFDDAPDHLRYVAEMIQKNHKRF